MKTFSITDMDGFVESIRHGAAQSISEEYTENLDDFLTLKQVELLIVKKSLGKDSDDLYVITEDIFDDIFEDIRSEIYQAALAKLAARGIIECAWDDAENRMVFWMDSPKQGKININSMPGYSDDGSPENHWGQI